MKRLFILLLIILPVASCEAVGQFLDLTPAADNPATEGVDESSTTVADILEDVDAPGMIGAVTTTLTGNPMLGAAAAAALGGALLAAAGRRKKKA